MAYRMADTPQAEKAQTLIETLRWGTDHARKNSKLSPEGKKAQIAGLYLETRKHVEKLRAEAAQERTTRIAALRRELFGMAGTSDPQSVISYRDAQDRVGALKLDEEHKAAALLDQAQLSGDEIMVKAVIQRAIDAGWANVANTYIEAHPYYGSKLEELWDLTPPENGGSNAIDLFDEAAAFYISTPPELGSYPASDQELERIAAAGD